MEKYHNIGEIRFAVWSDLHYFAPELGISGPAFEREQISTMDIKLLAEADLIIDSAMREIENDKPQFLLVCGDLTKDGEEVSHKNLAKKLKKLGDKGIPVFVINGNHDILNHRAGSFAGDKKTRVPTVTADEFKTIYTDFGYRAAYSHAPDSLSYAVEPVPGLVIVMLDSCCWRDKLTAAGKLYRETLVWLRQVASEARVRQKMVAVVMHHGIMEHYPGNYRFYPDYIVYNFPEIGRLFVGLGIQLVFSGHFHAQDIARSFFDSAGSKGKYLYDIETGSLLTYPCPYRIISLKDGRAKIESRRISRVSGIPGDFAAYAYHYCYELATKKAYNTLRSWRISGEDAGYLAPQIINAFLAHISGNEEMSAKPLDVGGVSWFARLIMEKKRPLLEGLWAQQQPPDNNLIIDLTDGSFTSPE